MKKSLIAMLIFSATLVACGDKDTASDSGEGREVVEDTDSGLGM